MVVGSPLFNRGFVGQDFIWWIGQVADDSYWRDNTLPSKFESAETIPGWGYRYKVRIFGLHDLGEEVIKSEDLPWANIMYPVTAGAYLTNSGQTPMIRQGNIVFGFFLDGNARQQPVIMGCMGNNSQTDLATTIGDNRVTNTTSGKSLGVSGYSQGNIDYPGGDGPAGSGPTTYDGNLKTEKPASKEVEQERAPASPGAGLNKYGLPANRPISKQQLQDIRSAKFECEERGLSAEECDALVRKRVQAGVGARVKEANSPRSPSTGQPNLESEGTMRQSIADVKRDKMYCQKRVLLKPDNIVESVNKAMQIDMDNLTQNIDKSMNALQSYTDAASMTEGLRSLEKMVGEASLQQSKYMKVVMDKCMEFTEKALNKEMTKAVSALPMAERMAFLDVKDGIAQNLLSSYNGMTGGQAGLMKGIISKVLNLGALTEQFSQMASGDTSPNTPDQKPKAVPKVPPCTSEDMIATVLAVNKSVIDETNNNLINNVDGFLQDAMANMAGVSGSMTSMFSKLGAIKGSLTTALNFENIKMNVFPFELPPSPAVSDYYTFCGGGAAADDAPSIAGIAKAATSQVDKLSKVAGPLGEVVGDKVAKMIPQSPITAFAPIPKNMASIDLTDPSKLISGENLGRIAGTAVGGPVGGMVGQYVGGKIAGEDVSATDIVKDEVLGGGTGGGLDIA